MKVTRLGAPQPILNAGLGQNAGGRVPPGGNDLTVLTSNGSNGRYWGENVRRITSNGSNILLSPDVNFASGSNITFAIASNTLTVHGQGASGTGLLTDQGSFTYLDAIEAAAPGTPGAGKARIYAKADGRIYSKDDGGVEYGPFSSGGGGGSDYIATVAGEANLVQYWPLNEASGTSFHDELGGTAMTSVGAVPVAVGGPMLQRDVLGGSIGIDINTQRITRTAITWPAQWTMELWAMISRAGTDSGSLFAQWNGAGAMVLITGNDVRCYLNNDGSFTAWTATAAELRGRHHVLIGYDGTNRKLYWDGVEKVSAAATNPTTNQGGELCVGAYSGGAGAAERAVRSDFAYYDTFDSGRALAHYNLGA